ncbi:response regulator transcription factor [Clostridium sp. D2Q-11]|uniref:Response regulator transcription factor n=1 Tax=Anaeromonas frigoriresistens TaxID=2683708 RepID=A0A942UXT4_9FIRM|nr:response regulator transcription factor [Anaeromonas frigoriresistens]MBS4538931.1 response regulator transcription factor [Anaeromonas frigoriresistens]
MINVQDISQKKILIIDDEIEILNLLETVLMKEGFQRIFKASNGIEGVKLGREENPDIIILDIMLPDIDGYEVCRQIRDYSIVPIIFLSAKTDDLDKLLGLGLGGDDYVTKPFSPKEVAFRIKAHFRRNEYFNIENKLDNKKQYHFDDIKLDSETGEVFKGSRLISLTAKEYGILLFLARHPNQILSKNKICENVWGDEYIGYDNTIMVHIRHLREKLEDNPSDPKYIKTIKGLGYKLSIGRD